MNFLVGIFNGLLEIWSHRLRSLLTITCVLLGVASLVLISGFVDGLFINWKRSMSEQGGIEKLAITPNKVSEKQRAIRGISPGRTKLDAEMIRNLSRYSVFISPEVDLQDSKIRHKGKSFEVRTSGVTEEIFPINKYEVQEGRPICPIDVDRASNVIVLGSAVVQKIFANGERALDSIVTVNGIPFVVVGLLKNYELQSWGYNLLQFKNEIAFIPLTTMQRKIFGGNNLSWLNVQIKDVSNLREAVDELENITIRSHRGIDDIQVKTREESLQQLNSTQKNFYIVGIGIAAITLLVGGIGIMNLMLASINERVREIGIRKALGAWNEDILIQFLVEAVTLSILGGTVGIVVGIGAISLLQEPMKQFSPPVFSWTAVFVGFSFSVLIGISSGLYPAIKASRLDPIDALRYE